MSDILSLHQQFREHCVVLKRLRPKYIRSLQISFDLFVQETGVTDIRQVSQSLVEDWLIKCAKAREWSPKTIRTRLSDINAFCKWCFERRIIDENPTASIPKPKLKETIPKHLTVSQAFQLLEWVERHRFHYPFEKARAIAIIAMFIYTGLRISELLSLQMNHVKMLERTVYVENGKGNKDRMIPMNDALFHILDSYLSRRAKLKRTCPHFFASLTYNSGISQNALRRLVYKVREGSGIHFYPHLLRHTFATLMLEGGCDIYSLSKMMGHTKIQTTTIYLSATMGLLKKEVSKHPLAMMR